MNTFNLMEEYAYQEGLSDRYEGAPYNESLPKELQEFYFRGYYNLDDQHIERDMYKHSSNNQPY